MHNIIRDTQTGRFASFDTYNRSHSHGGTRYEVQTVGAPPEDEPDEPDFFDDDFTPYDLEFGVDYGEE